MMENMENGKEFAEIEDVIECGEKSAFEDMANAFGDTAAAAMEQAVTDFFKVIDRLENNAADTDLATAYFMRRYDEMFGGEMKEIKNYGNLFFAYMAGINRMLDMKHILKELKESKRAFKQCRGYSYRMESGKAIIQDFEGYHTNKTNKEGADNGTETF